MFKELIRIALRLALAKAEHSRTEKKDDSLSNWTEHLKRALMKIMSMLTSSTDDLSEQPSLIRLGPDETLIRGSQ